MVTPLEVTHVARGSTIQPMPALRYTIPIDQWKNPVDPLLFTELTYSDTRPFLPPPDYSGTLLREQAEKETNLALAALKMHRREEKFLSEPLSDISHLIGRHPPLDEVQLAHKWRPSYSPLYSPDYTSEPKRWRVVYDDGDVKIKSAQSRPEALLEIRSQNLHTHFGLDKHGMTEFYSSKPLRGAGQRFTHEYSLGTFTGLDTLRNWAKDSHEKEFGARLKILTKVRGGVKDGATIRDIFLGMSPFERDAASSIPEVLNMMLMETINQIRDARQ